MLNQKILTNQINMGLQQRTWVEKRVHGVETHWISGKEKVSGAAVSKVAHADSLLEHDKIYHYLFP